MRTPKFQQNTDGRAFATWPRSNGKREYFGKYGDPDAERKYHQWLSRLFAEEAAYVPPAPKASRRTINMLVEQHLRQMEALASGSPNWDKKRSDFANQKLALSSLLLLFGDDLAEDFGPRKLLILQRYYIKAGLARSTINGRVGRIKRFFRWAAAQEFVPPSVHWGMTAVAGLRKGRTAAKETRPIRPVPWEHVSAILPFVPPVIAAMSQVQFFCGMRPAEVCQMRPCDIDRSGDVWLYEPASHKNDWKELSLTKAIPLIAQKILEPFLTGRSPEDFLFSPRDTDRWRRETVLAKSGKARKTKVYPCEARRREKERAETASKHAAGKSHLRPRYNAGTFYKAVQRGFARAKKSGVSVQRWHPNQLRHSIATQIDGWFGRQAAMRWLGHTKMDTTQIYVEHQVSELITLARELDRRWIHPSAGVAPDAVRISEPASLVDRPTHSSS